MKLHFETSMAPQLNEDSDNLTYKCNVLYKNHSQFKILPGTFEGIPQNLLLNVIIWLVLLILFTFLRKRAWDYGRIALVQRNAQKLLQIFYRSESPSSEEVATDPTDSALRQDKGICSWLRAIFLIKNEQILRRNGPDALQYLSFQRHVILYLSIVCVVCLVVILPVNLQGQLEADGDFGRTTMSNLDPDSQLIWVHIILSFLTVPLGISIMRHFSSNLKFGKDEDLISRTLMITRIPKDFCCRDPLLQHFQESFEDCVIENIEFAFDVKKLINLDRRRETALQARVYCERIRDTTKRLKMRPFNCGRICCLPHCHEVDALDFYTREERSLTAAVEAEKAIALTKPLGICFVTFQKETMAEMVYKDHRRSCRTRRNLSSALAPQLRASQWIINFAPPPEDLFWENLSTSSFKWYIKATVITIILFLIFLFVSTPAIVLHHLDFMNLMAVKEFVERTPFLSEFVPTVVLLAISVILPFIVRYSDQFMSHWTRSTRNNSIMVKTYIFLLFMVVLLPVLQLTSVEAFLKSTLFEGNIQRFKCIFISGNGAFFINYVITTTFIGSALELIRFPELVMYLLQMCWSRSVAEQSGSRQAVLWEFEFGVQYAWFLLMFTVISIYSLVVPLMLPFGVLCVGMKHCIDRHNIFFVYAPSKINKNIHDAALNMIVLALILMQIFMFFFVYLKKGWTQMSIVSISICFFTAMVFLMQMSFHWFQVLSPIAYRKLTRRASNGQNEAPGRSVSVPNNLYVPTVLKKSHRAGDFTPNIPERSYGTNEDSIAPSPDCDEEDAIMKRDLDDWDNGRF